MAKFSVRLCWTSAERDELVEEVDERARFMAYDIGQEVPDEDVAKVNRALRPTSEKVEAKPTRKPQGKTGLRVDGGRSKRS